VSILATAITLAGCGTEAPRTPVSASAASLLEAACRRGSNHLLAIDQRHPHVLEGAAIGRFIEQDATEAETVDQETTETVSRLPATAHKTVALADLAQSRSNLKALVRNVQGHDLALTDLRGLFLSLARASGGCYRVKLRQPING
jgi:hypothetical protein